MTHTGFSGSGDGHYWSKNSYPGGNVQQHDAETSDTDYLDEVDFEFEYTVRNGAVLDHVRRHCRAFRLYQGNSKKQID